MKIVIGMGGSVLCPEGSPNLDYMKGFRKLVLELAGEHRIVIVVGGGGIAREMIGYAEKAGVRDRDLRDMIGIMATRFNASLVMAVIGNGAYARIPESEEEAAEAFKSGKIVVMGGLRPRQTTDAVSVQVAREIGADLIVVATNVKGVYTHNPFKYSYARFIESLSPKQLLEIVKPCDFRPGHSGVLDPVAARLLLKSRIRAVVLDGRDLGNMRNALEGKRFTGTIIE